MQVLPECYFKDTPELTLWRSALASYLNEVKHWHKYRKPVVGDNQFYTASAYADFHGNRCQLNRLCEFAGYDPDYIREKFSKLMQKEAVIL
jgi:hypothetical protein